MSEYVEEDLDRPALLPTTEGVVTRDGVQLAYATYGTAGPTVVLLPTWSIAPSRFWKAQVPYLSRHCRVVTFDGRGAGRSGRPTGAASYTDTEYAADTLAVMDAVGVDDAVLVSWSCGAAWSVHAAVQQPDRVRGLFVIGPSCGLAVPQPKREAYPFDQKLDTTEGWAKYNKHYWLDGGYDDFVDFFFSQMYTEPHSTKQIEDCVRWAHQISPETLVDVTAGRLGCDGAVCEHLEPYLSKLRCAVTVICGTDDQVRTYQIGERFAELTNGSLILVEGAGHGLLGRDPVLVNRHLKDFIDTLNPTVARQTRVRAANRPKRALYISSPIGLGHARRDVAIADELRLRRPGLQIDWLAQNPVTRLLNSRNELVHPASDGLLNESRHIECESGEHNLNAFQAMRRMDEILVNNFMVFADLIEREDYDLVIGDEAWEVDYFLHENPELKRSAYAWLTDFVGWLPMPDGGPDEAALTADYNAEMIEHRARFRRVRDLSVFVGNPADVVPDDFGPGLPSIRGWTEDNFDFAGYVTGFDPAELGERAELRTRLGYRDDERVCVVTVGGSGVGGHLLQRVADAIPIARRSADDLRVVVVTGPRIDPSSLTWPAGVDVHGYLPDLPRHLSACDAAVVQGGLTTCMELTATSRPFIYVPLRRHFEQNIHVRHRLDNYHAGQHLPYDEAADPDALAAGILAQLGRSTDYRQVETDGAARAADLLAELI